MPTQNEKKEERTLGLIQKTDEKKNLVWAEVYVPDVPDTHGDFMSAEEIEKAAYRFPENLRLHKIDEAHNNRSIGVWVVETFIVRKGDPDFDVPGAWVVGLQLTDEMMDKVMKGEINGLSMEGMVRKEPRMIEIEVPEKIRGTTIKSEGSDHDHVHDYTIEFQDDGSIIGVTSKAGDPPHKHVIKRGTATEKVDPQGRNLGHNHRFSIVEHLKLVEEGD